MPLGKIRVANGTPKAEALYGISKSDTDETLIERIDLSTGGVTRVATLGIGRGIACAVGLPGSGWIYGVCSGSMAGFDLTMNYYDDSGTGIVSWPGISPIPPSDSFPTMRSG